MITNLSTAYDCKSDTTNLDWNILRDGGLFNKIKTYYQALSYS